MKICCIYCFYFNAEKARKLAKRLVKEAARARKHIIDAETKKSARQIASISKKELVRMKNKIVALERQLKKKAKEKARKTRKKHFTRKKRKK